MKRIAVDLAKSIFQAAERVLVGLVGRCEVAQFWGACVIKPIASPVAAT